MSSRALSFGVMADAYERFRPGYPVELFDMVMTYAGRPVRTALEIGAGTGKATRLFAQRGVTVTATEPDGAMLAELHKYVPANVKTVQAAFEDLRPGESYGLVYAAGALHWTNPEGRWSRMAALLEPGGAFASLAPGTAGDLTSRRHLCLGQSRTTADLAELNGVRLSGVRLLAEQRRALSYRGQN